MIIDNSKFDFSLNDATKLRKLILENPDLPLLIFAGEESWSDNFPYEQVDASRASVETLTLYGDIWMDEDDYEDRLRDNLCDFEEYKNLSDKEYDKMIEQKIAETVFAKAITVYVG